MKLLAKEVTKKFSPPKKKSTKNCTEKTSPSLWKFSKIASQTDNSSTKGFLHKGRYSNSVPLHKRLIKNQGN
jgi:hypothetical protein